MIGQPKYNYGDKVSFKFPTPDGVDTFEGTIYIIDAYGTWDDPSDVSYDILSKSENCLYKHISEREVTKIEE